LHVLIPRSDCHPSSDLHSNRYEILDFAPILGELELFLGFDFVGLIFRGKLLSLSLSLDSVVSNIFITKPSMREDEIREAQKALESAINGKESTVPSF